MSSSPPVHAGAPSVGALRKRVLQGSAVIIFGSIGWQFLRLIGSVVLARLLGPEQFGIAAMLLLVVAFVEMISGVGIDRHIVQDPNGDTVEFLSTSHTVSAIRGVISAAIILIIARPVAWMLGVDNFAWVFAILAIVPICMGFCHFDRKRFHRVMRFAPDMQVDIFAQIASLSAGIFVAWWTRSFIAAMCAIITNAIAVMVASFLVSERPYKLGWDSKIALSIFRFGWPLVLSNALLFIIMHGERGILAAAPKLFPSGRYDLTDLGLFAAAWTLAYAPVVVVSRLGSTMSLPILAAVRQNQTDFKRRYRQITLFLIVSGALMVLGFYFFGSWSLRVLYGHQYSEAAGILIFLAIAQAFKVIGMGPVVAVLAIGNSKIALYSNIVRMFGVGLGVYTLMSDWPVVWLAGAAAVAEGITLAATSLMARAYLRSGLCSYEA